MSFKNFNRQLEWLWQPAKRRNRELWTANQKSMAMKYDESPQIVKHK